MPGFQVFLGSLISGQLPAASAAELDALLQWLAGRRNRSASMVENAFRTKGIPKDAARRLVLAYLDKSLFGHGDDYYRLLGVSPESGLAAIRFRHKQLLQVFHPDRHADQRAWFTERTEQLNRAYAQLKKSRGKPRSGRFEAGGAAPSATVRRPEVRAGRKASARKSLMPNKNIVRRTLKERLGTSEQFERRFYVVLFLVPVIALLIMYFNYTAVPERGNTVAPDKRQGSIRSTFAMEKSLKVGVASRYQTQFHSDPGVRNW